MNTLKEEIDWYRKRYKLAVNKLTKRYIENKVKKIKEKYKKTAKNEKN